MTDPISTIFKIPQGDWSALLWMISVAIVVLVLYPLLQLIRAKISSLTPSVSSQELETYTFRNQLAKQMGEIVQLIKELREDVLARKGSGFLDSEQDVIRIVHKHFDFINKEFYSFFLARLHKNHIDTRVEFISVEYAQYSSTLSGKMHGYLKHWSYQNKPLSDFFAGNGADKYCKYISEQLFTIQRQNDKSIMEQVDNGLARCTSHLLSDFKIWLSTGDSITERWDTLKEDYKLIKTLNDVEKL